jgi:hypothetical protein
MTLISGAALSAGESSCNYGERDAQMRQACDLLAAVEALRDRLGVARSRYTAVHKRAVLKRRVGS